ncbi:hypothetical protein FPV67DRAFT_1460881 [Lyophyllum atratum]|nr:hypothetical protein FPV67DRAFT_1460881 [Lyophyllum atratum]
MLSGAEQFFFSFSYYTIPAGMCTAAASLSPCADKLGIGPAVAPYGEWQGSGPAALAPEEKFWVARLRCSQRNPSEQGIIQRPPRTNCQHATTSGWHTENKILRRILEGVERPVEPGAGLGWNEIVCREIYIKGTMIPMIWSIEIKESKGIPHCKAAGVKFVTVNEGHGFFHVIFPEIYTSYHILVGAPVPVISEFIAVNYGLQTAAVAPATATSHLRANLLTHVETHPNSTSSTTTSQLPLPSRRHLSSDMWAHMPTRVPTYVRGKAFDPTLTAAVGREERMIRDRPTAPLRDGNLVADRPILTFGGQGLFFGGAVGISRRILSSLPIAAEAVGLKVVIDSVELGGDHDHHSLTVVVDSVDTCAELAHGRPLVTISLHRHAAGLGWREITISDLYIKADDRRKEQLSSTFTFKREMVLNNLLWLNAVEELKNRTHIEVGGCEASGRLKPPYSLVTTSAGVFEL